ncbi:hypothetical protein RB213_014690 [Colletotrichum asianum]
MDNGCHISPCRDPQRISDPHWPRFPITEQ